MSFRALLDYGLSRGAGRPLRDGTSEPWTVEALEDGFETLNRPVSSRSIENWRSGRNVPSARNVHALASLFGGGDRRLQRRWLDALLAARSATPPADIDIVAETDPKPTPPATGPKASRRWRLGGLATAIVGCLIAAWLWSVHAGPTPIIDDIRFCLKDDFDTLTNRCSVAQRTFPTETALIYVSFESHDVPYGKPFTRVWFHEGREYMRRNGFFDEAWENWTWIINERGHKPGDYALRLVIDNHVFTGKFTVLGEVEPFDPTASGR